MPPSPVLFFLFSPAVLPANRHSFRNSLSHTLARHLCPLSALSVVLSTVPAFYVPDSILLLSGVFLFPAALFPENTQFLFLQTSLRPLHQTVHAPDMSDPRPGWNPAEHLFLFLPLHLL